MYLAVFCFSFLSSLSFFLFFSSGIELSNGKTRSYEFLVFSFCFFFLSFLFYLLGDGWMDFVPAGHDNDDV